MEGMAAGQRARAVASSHHVLADDAGRFVLEWRLYQSAGEMPLPQSLNCSRHCVRLLTDCYEGCSGCSAQQAGVCVGNDGVAITQRPHVRSHMLRGQKHPLR